MPTFVAIDLGATSGRVVRVRVAGDSIRLEPVHRFATQVIDGPGGARRWDIDALLREVRVGVDEAVRRGGVESVGVAAWGVDYGLLDRFGRLLGPVHSYRSSRTDGVLDEVVARIGRERIFRITGSQFLPINTLYQLVSARGTAEVAQAERLLMMPDVVNHELCGSTTTDVTAASTTQLLDISTRTWSDELAAAAGLRRDLLPPLHEPGVVLGATDGGVPVVAVASHDTASAVAGTPLRPGSTDVYISCGTWALVGCELAAPVTSPAALAANVTNELGVEGSVRLLKNVTGLWLLEESRRWWSTQGQPMTAPQLVAAAEQVPGGRSVIDPDDPRFAAPGDLPVRIAAACAESGQRVPASPAEITRTILDSLAATWRASVATIERVTGTAAERIHLVGGGAAIGLLGRLCASVCERPVHAGPVEATVIGNAIVQAVAAGVLDGVADGREIVGATAPIETFTPERLYDWDALAPAASPAS